VDEYSSTRKTFLVLRKQRFWFYKMLLDIWEDPFGSGQETF